MAAQFSTRKLEDMKKIDLIEAIKRLRTKNFNLQQKTQQAEHAGHPDKKLLQAARLRSVKHRCEKERLEQMSYIVKVAFITILFVNLMLFIYAGILGVDEYGIKRIHMPPKYLSTNFQWLVDDKIGSILIATLRFLVSVPSQMTFPAPYRSFAAVSLFAIKQVMLLFLPKWCIGFIILFAIFAITMLDWDRKKQVSFF
ncbi:hypothetical protein I4U23_011542 [Adineta vaga]|nr:hypothetical protein I4U23_011542 [Adineta vaga]